MFVIYNKQNNKILRIKAPFSPRSSSEAIFTTNEYAQKYLFDFNMSSDKYGIAEAMDFYDNIEKKKA